MKGVMANGDSLSGQINWQEVIFEPGFMGRLEGFARKRFGDNSLAEEACAFSLGKLLDPGWQARRLSLYGGKASPPGFIFSAFRMLLEDFSRQRFGRPRPPAWLKRLGPFWEKLFTLLCLERLDSGGIHSRLQSGNDQELQERIEEAAWVIRSRVTNCGEQIGETLHDFQEYDMGSGASEHGGGASEFEEKSARETAAGIFSSLAAVFAYEQGGDCDQGLERIESASARSLAGKAAERALRFQLRLADEDKLLLRMVYQDGYKISEAARILGTQEHTLRRRLKRSMDDLRSQLEEQGLGLEVVQSLLD
jgi:hypothetical protein